MVTFVVRTLFCKTAVTFLFAARLQSFGRIIHTMVKHNQGMHEVISFAEANAQLAGLLNEFLSARELIAVQYPPETAEQIAWEQTELFPVVYLLNGEPQERQATQIDYVSEFVSMVQIALNMSVDEFTMDNRVVYYIVQNDDTLHDSFEQSMLLRFDKFNADYSKFRSTVCVYLGMHVVCAGAMLTVRSAVAPPEVCGEDVAVMSRSSASD